MKHCLEHLNPYVAGLVEQQAAEEEKTEICNVILFNRPIWILRKEFWPNEDGFCHIYGLISDSSEKMDEEYLNMCILYLGYLAMCEEYYLFGITSSGFTADRIDPTIWYNNGIEYSARDKEVKEECHHCRMKHNLKLRAAVVPVPEKAIMEGVQDNMILSQKVYESLIESVATANSHIGCPE